MAKRKAIGKKLRFDVFKRDGFACQYCGATPPGAALWVDHIVPVVDGGGNDIDNLATACDRCNLGKGAGSLSDVPRPLKERAAETREREAQLRGYTEVMFAKRARLENDAWQVANILLNATGEEAIRKDWFRSITRFVEKIGVYETCESMWIAVDRIDGRDDEVFKYFCGICWKKTREVES